MKNLVILFLINLGLIPSSMAGVNYENFASQIQKVEVAEQSYNIVLAFQVLERLTSETLEALKVGEVVAEVETQLNTMLKEVVTKNQVDSAKFSLLGFLSFGGTNVRNSTKFVGQNPQEVSQFPEKTRQDFADLQGKISAYINENKQELFLLQLLIAKTLELASKLDSLDLAKYASRVDAMYLAAKLIKFNGVQTISECTVTEHASYVNKVSVGLDSWLFSGGYSKTDSHEAYSETVCKVSQKSASQAFRDTPPELDLLIDALYLRFGKNYLVRAKSAVGPLNSLF